MLFSVLFHLLSWNSFQRNMSACRGVLIDYYKDRITSTGPVSLLYKYQITDKTYRYLLINYVWKFDIAVYFEIIYMETCN